MMHALYTDRSLVNRTLRGDRDAFGGLVERHRRSIYAVALAVSRNHADAEDAAQDAFLKAFETLPALREPRRFAPWVAHIARNLCRDRLRSAQRRQELAPEAPSAIDPADSFAREDVHALVREQVGRLDDLSREALTLYYYGGRNTREIAALLDITPAAAKKRLERARAALGKQLLDELGGARAKDEDEAAHLKRILLALSATTPAWFAGATEGAGLALSAGMVAKVAAGLAVAAATVSVGAMLANQSQSNPTAAESAVEPAAPMPSPEAEPILLAANDDPELPAPEAAAPPEPAVAERTLSIDPAALERAVGDALTKPMSVSMDDTHISEILGFLAKYLEFGVITLNETEDYNPAYVTDGNIESIDLENVPLQTALEETLFPLGLALAIEPGYLWVSTPERIRAEIGRPTAKEAERLPDDAKLAAPVSMSFSDVHVSEAADFLSAHTETSILLDYRVIRPAPKKKRTPLSGGETPFQTPAEPETEPYEPKSGHVPYINLSNVLVVDALRGMLRSIEYEYRVMPGYLIVGSKGSLAAADIVHEYGTGAYAPDVAAWLESDAVLALEGGKQHTSHLVSAIETSGKAALGEDFTVRLASPDLGRVPAPAAAFHEGVPMVVALDAILGAMKLRWSMEGYTFVIREGGA